MTREEMRYKLNELRMMLNDGEHGEEQGVLVEIISELDKGEWIPVSERLPDNNVIVLCSAISTSISGGYTRFVGCCNNGFWFVQTDAETVSYPRQYKVTAWMPLPEVYKEER